MCIPGELDWGGTYFWRVRALQPSPSEWALGTFTILPAPVPQVVPQPSALESLPFVTGAEAVPVWVWLVMIVLAILIIVIIVYSLVGRRK